MSLPKKIAGYVDRPCGSRRMVEERYRTRTLTGPQGTVLKVKEDRPTRVMTQHCPLHKERWHPTTKGEAQRLRRTCLRARKRTIFKKLMSAPTTLDVQKIRDRARWMAVNMPEKEYREDWV